MRQDVMRLYFRYILNITHLLLVMEAIWWDSLVEVNITHILESVMGRDLISIKNLTACSCLLPKVSFYERYMEQQMAQDNITHILLAKYDAISSVTKLCFKHNFCCWHSSIHCLGSDLRHVQCHSLSVSMIRCDIMTSKSEVWCTYCLLERIIVREIT